MVLLSPYSPEGPGRHIYIFLGASWGPFGRIYISPLEREEKSAPQDVVDIMGFNFRHVAPIVRKSEKWQKKPIAKVGRLSFFDP